MPSDRTPPLLNAFADGELSPLTAARVRRHLKTCAACRAEYEALQALGAQARAWHDVTAPPMLSVRLDAAIERLSTTEENTPMPSTAITLAPARPRIGLPWQPLAGAGVFAALLAAAALLMPGSPGRPTVAYAAVRQAMRGVRAVSWIETQTRDKGGRVILHNTHRFWVRRDPPAVAEWYCASTLPQVPGEEYAGPTKSLSDARGQTYFHTREGVYYLHPTPGIQREVANTIDGLTASRVKDYGRPERVTLNGHPALRFHQRAPEYDVTIWADPHTLRVVRKRTDEINHFPTGAEHIVLDATGFQYDTPAPAGVFDLTLPPGAHVTEDDGKGHKTVVVDQPAPKLSVTPSASAILGPPAMRLAAADRLSPGAVPRVLTIVAMHPRGSSLMPTSVSDALGDKGVAFAIAVREPVSRARQLEAFAAHAGHEFLLEAPGRPAVRAALSGLTVVDTGRQGGDFRGFGLRVMPGEERKIVWKPATTYTLRPLNAGHPCHWVVDDSTGDVVLHFGGG